MGCVTSLPPEQSQSKDTDGIILVSDPRPNTPSLTPIDSNVAQPKQDQTKPDPKKKTKQILSDKGILDIPDGFHAWFPSNHGHRDVSTLFKWCNELGHGVTGSVHKIEFNSQIYALKRIDKSDEWSRMLFMTEAQALTHLDHPGIIALHDMYFDADYYYLLLDKADFDLYYVMKKKGHLSEKKTRNITYALLNALQYMHSKNVVHRDLKPENIVFVATDTNNPQLIDFGDAEMVKNETEYTEFVGTPPYMSPERLDQHYGWQLKKGDIWALAVIAYEMYCGQRCFVGHTGKQVFGRILRNQWTWPQHRAPSDDFKDFIEQCLNSNAEERPSANDALEHRWFDVIRNEQQSQNKHHNAIRTMIEHVAECEILDGLASMVNSNALQDIIVKVHTERMSNETIGTLQCEFDRLDSDKDGYISEYDLENLFTKCEIKSEHAVSLAAVIISEMNCNNDTKISFEHFMSARSKCQISNESLQIYQDIMSLSDADDTECKLHENEEGISINDIVNYCRTQSSQFDTDYDENCLRDVFTAYDKDNKGRLNLQEFMDAVSAPCVVDVDIRSLNMNNSCP